MSLHTAHYPPFGSHPSTSAAPSSISLSHQNVKQAAKIISTRSDSVAQAPDKPQACGRSSTPTKNVYTIFDPSTTSTSPITQSTSTIETRAESIPACSSCSRTIECPTSSRSGSRAPREVLQGLVPVDPAHALTKIPPGPVTMGYSADVEMSPLFRLSSSPMTTSILKTFMTTMIPSPLPLRQMTLIFLNMLPGISTTCKTFGATR